MSVELARKLRAQASPPERAMWKILWDFRRRGYHFRRQVLIGTYYADFACRAPSIVIEVDGDSHGTDVASSNDAVRDDYMRGRGYRVLRFWNSEVIRNPDGVYLSIAKALAALPPPTPHPSPRGGGEQS